MLAPLFVGLKPGFWLGEGPDHTGELVCDDLDIPPAAFEGASCALRLIGPGLAAAALPRRSRLAHKGSAGRVVIAGGGPGMPGAVRLAAEAALRVGAGLVTVLTHPAHAASLVIARPEIICHGIDDAAAARAHLEAADVIALGPGLGQSAWARAMYAAVVDRPGLRVLDADALNLLSQAPCRAGDWILTPHPGEAGRLLGRGNSDSPRDRHAAVLELAASYCGGAGPTGAGSRVARLSCGSGCAISSRRSATSATRRASGPSVASTPIGDAGQAGTRNWVGFRPATPQKAAGMRTEPSPSVPTWRTPTPRAAAAPAPAEEPPVVRVASHGFRVAPWRGESPRPFQPNSGIAVWPSTTQPASQIGRASCRERV